MDTQDDFVAARRSSWQALEELLGREVELHLLPPPAISQAGALYRDLCADLMRARSAGYDHELVTHLDGLAARAHNLLHGARPVELGALTEFVARSFPRALRRNARFFAIASALFVLPMAGALAATLLDPDFATAILPKSALEGAARSYAEGLQGRESSTDATMAGFYIRNNIGIAFRCFSAGILFGLGAAFFLLYNGLVIGATIGFVIARGHGENILTFVCGHAPFELTAICIAGGAGIQMGYAMIRTGGRTRLGSLRAAAPEVGAVVGGAALMLLIAAMVEGFWSPSGAPPPLKWAVAAIFTILVAAYLALAGRRGGGR
ncbi:MAG: stage II sporulation protein M [Myxococcales bacterium]|nr:stage II sporulation protein M [Myxococcales bacterium]MCB9701260.1 stage II sporulation protein M [Myxococcales bacterium]